MKKKIVTVTAALLILAGIFLIALRYVDNDSERTDDAQLEQYISPINVKVPGYINEIRFTEHQYVHKGDTLMIIDGREYAIALQQAEAALIDAKNGQYGFHKRCGIRIDHRGSRIACGETPARL